MNPLHRSNSSSHIPVRQRSKSTGRTSVKDATGVVGCASTSKTRVRSGSFDRLQVPALKRSGSYTSLFRKTTITPKVQTTRYSRLNTKDITPTPSSSRSRSRSPYRIGSAVNDKKWVSQQFSKVLNFLARFRECDYITAATLKPPNIKDFVFVINVLFKEIDGRSEVNTVNYKEEVLSTLKLLHYPGTVSLSLLKTVNTLHSWPQIIAIFGWLVDLILFIKPQYLEIDEPLVNENISKQKAKCIKNYITSRYMLYNSDQDETVADENCKLEMEKIYNINIAEIKAKTEKLELEISKLVASKEKKSDLAKEQEKINDRLKKEMTNMQLEIDDYYEDTSNKQMEAEHVLQQLKERKIRLSEDIKNKKVAIATLKETISKQPCSYEEKMKILTEIDEMKHTLELKKEYVSTLKAVTERHDKKIAGCKKNLKKEIYNFNQQLIELIEIKPELKLLHLDEVGFLDEDFGSKIQQVIDNKAMLETKFIEEIETKKKLLHQSETEYKNLTVNINNIRKDIENMKKEEKHIEEQIEQKNLNISNLKEEDKTENEILNKEIQRLNNSRPDLKLEKEKLEQITQRAQERNLHLEKTMKETLLFFVGVHKKNIDYLRNMNAVTNEVLGHFKEALDKIFEQEAKILKDLQTLETLKKDFDSN